MDRRAFLSYGVGAAAGAAAAGLFDCPWKSGAALQDEYGPYPPAFSIIPVVGDGKWIWTKPPQEIGYLEPRRFELQIGIQQQGRGNAAGIPIAASASHQR